MYMTPRRIALLLTLLSPLAAAQEQAPVLAQVDLLLFRQLTTSPEQTSAIAVMPPRPGDVMQAGVELFARADEGEAGDVRLVRGPGKLGAELDALDASDNFEVLHQVSWRQPVYDLQDALHVSLLPERRDGLLKGNAKLSFHRYFQLSVTLLYEPGFAAEEPSERDRPESDKVFIHLRETMTDNQLYYLDHPLVGALARVTVFDPETPGGE